MEDTYFVAPNFINDSSNQSILSIRFATDGFSFCVHDETDTLTAFVHEPYAADSKEAAVVRLKHHILNDSLLNLHYKRVYVLPCFREKTLIPGAYFQADTAAELCALVQETAGDETTLLRHVEELDAYLATPFPVFFKQFIEEQFPAAQIVDPAYLFIKESLQKALADTEQLFAEIGDTYFDLIATRDGRMTLFNTFAYRGATDIAYHLLNCAQTLGMDRQRAQVSIGGANPEGGKLRETLAAYLPNLYRRKDARLNALLGNRHFDGTPFTHLLNIHQCGL